MYYSRSIFCNLQCSSEIGSSKHYIIRSYFCTKGILINQINFEVVVVVIYRVSKCKKSALKKEKLNIF